MLPIRPTARFKIQKRSEKSGKTEPGPGKTEENPKAAGNTGPPSPQIQGSQIKRRMDRFPGMPYRAGLAADLYHIGF
jgi:hypothetical protein